MIRGIGLRGAVAVNVITMIGIGPLITIPLVLADLHGSIALVAWVVGALIALCDGLAWAELGSLYPGSGGTYVFLRETFGDRSWGRMLAFLFTWQIVLSAPLVLASGYIGFAHYAGYLWPRLGNDARLQGEVAAAVGIVTLVALYRPITTIGKLGIALAGVAVATLGAIIVAAASRFSATQALSGDVHVGTLAALGAGLGPALVITLYDYYGYGQSCTVSDEVRDTPRVLPLSVVVSILGVGVLYVLVQLGVLGVVPWPQLVPATAGAAAPDAANYVASTVVERAWGAPAAVAVTVAILATAFASVFGNLLGYSRIPYASAVDGTFLRPFAHLDARGRFPNVSLVTIGLLALPACFLSLGDVINALTAGLVIIQSIAQLGAVVLLRVRGIRAPYRMWLFPLPLLLALGGWIYIFCSAGTNAIVFGCVTLAAGVVVYVVRARFARDWPFLLKSATAAGLVAAAVGMNAHAARAQAALPTWGHAATVEVEGNPVFEVDGKPFFVYGAAFFYERLPRDQWASSMGALQRLGVNTLDLYVPWNWHERSDGDFDFNGRTNPRRDLDDVLALARQYGFKILLRPGPVIRNEWRNGGYPAWLLSRPEYGMPLHDLLEGRYPPAATLQNQHADDAAAQWMNNATHMTYAKRWIQRVLTECAPAADLILAVALDDDQGAYIDNQTYPAPHFDAYINTLRDWVRGVTGPEELVYINTYQMKVTARAPVWAMGNWYQSAAYSIGAHDRAQLEFSMGLLHTRPGQPMMASEFQAGWLEQPDDIRPRPADPSNTLLAMATMIGSGVRGIVNFPAQDTMYPAGWEVPFANSFYAWDAALAFDGYPSARAAPTAEIGALVRRFGPDLAASRPIFDAAIVYLGSSLRADASTNDRFSDVESATIDAQEQCRNASLSCALVDPSALDDRMLQHYHLLLLPALSDGSRSLRVDVTTRLARLRQRGASILDASDGAATFLRTLRSRGLRPTVAGVTGATFAKSSSDRVEGFLSVPNYGLLPLHVAHATIADGSKILRLPPFDVAAHSALVVPVNVELAKFGTAVGRMLVSDCMPLDYAFDAHEGGANFSLRPYTSGENELTRYEVADYGHPCFADVDYGAGERQIQLDGKLNLVMGPGGRENAEDIWLPLQSPVRSPPATAVRVDVDLPGSFLAPFIRGWASSAVDDFERDGSRASVLENSMVAVVVEPEAGARAFHFQDLETGRNCFTTVGALRDDVAVEPPLLTSDRIAKYTHDFPAGMFNRPYDATPATGTERSPATASFSYDAPDVVPNGARFRRTITLAPGERAFTMDESVEFHGPGDASAQRAVSVTSLSVGAATTMDTERVLAPESSAFVPLSTVHVSTGHALGYYDTATHELATIAWRAGDVEDATILERRYSIVTRLILARGRTAHLRYGYDTAPAIEDANRLVAAADAAAQVAPSAPRTP